MNSDVQQPSCSDDGFSEEEVYDEQSSSFQQTEVPHVSLSSILKALTLKDITLTFGDVLKYAAVSLTVLIVLLYLFPNYLILLLLSMVLIVILIIGLVLRRIDIKTIPQSELQNIRNKPINKEKLQKLRNLLRNKQ